MFSTDKKQEQREEALLFSVLVVCNLALLSVLLFFCLQH